MVVTALCIFCTVCQVVCWCSLLLEMPASSSLRHTHSRHTTGCMFFKVKGDIEECWHSCVMLLFSRCTQMLLPPLHFCASLIKIESCLINNSVRHLKPRCLVSRALITLENLMLSSDLLRVLYHRCVFVADAFEIQCYWFRNVILESQRFKRWKVISWGRRTMWQS